MSDNGSVMRASVSEFPLVSIVTPSYNQAAFLEETIQSVLAQDYPNVEYIIVDGGSTDGSMEIISRYADRLAWWVSEPDRGQSDAINKGLRHSQGKYFGYINSDDLLMPSAVRAAVEYLESHPDVGMVYGDVEYIDAVGRTIRFYKSSAFDLVELVRSARNWVPQPGSLIRRDALDDVGGLDPEIQYNMDQEHLYRIGLKYPVAYVPVTLARFRLHQESKTVSGAERNARSEVLIYRKFFERADLPPSLRSLRSEAWCAAYLYAARACAYGNRRQLALGYVSKAAIVFPVALLSRAFWKACLYALAGESIVMRLGLVRCLPAT